MAVNAPEFRWSKTRNTKLKVLQTRSVTEIFRIPVISKRNDERLSLKCKMKSFDWPENFATHF